MKKSITLTLAILAIAIATVMATVPQKISYQAVVRNSSNALVVNSNIGMQISILQGSITGTAVYVERHFPTTNANGLITIQIGTGTIISGTYSTIDWSTGVYFVKSEYDLNGDSNYTISGTSQMLTVPYAQYAEKAGNGFSGNFSDLTNKPTTLTGYGITDGVNTTGTQTIAGNKIFTGTLSLSNKPIINLANPTNSTDAVNKSYVDEQTSTIINQLQDQISKLQNTVSGGGYVVDIDGNRYNTVKIGNQVWMAENLKTTRYNDGTKIPLVTDSASWASLTTGAFCYYKNDSVTYNTTYGALYNWYAVNTAKLAPTGWHVPTDAEWTILTNYLGGISVAGGKLKEMGTTHWISPNTGATNQTGFNAVPAGRRNENGFTEIGHIADFWSSTIYPYYTAAINRTLASDILSVYINNPPARFQGQSIRCIKD